jgi:hypothetical protein
MVVLAYRLERDTCKSVQVVLSSKEEAIANMQTFKAGLKKALSSKEESLRAGGLDLTAPIDRHCMREQSYSDFLLPETSEKSCS